MITIKQLHEEEGGKCYYCNCQTVIPKYNGSGANKKIINRPDNASREHLVPQKEGGLHNRINIKLACYQCNTLRGHMHAVTWKIIASSPSSRRGYIKMRQNQKFLKRNDKREDQLARRTAEIIEETCGIIVRHHTWSKSYIKQVFGALACQN